MEHFFTTFVRTKQVFKHRFNGMKDYDTVKLYQYELKKLDVKGPLIYSLRERGEIWYDNKGNFKALHRGPIDPSLLDRAKKRVKERAPLTDLHRFMRSALMHVELDAPVDKRKDISVYFKAFLDHRNEQLDAFFTVDSFSSRVHTPIVNLKGDLRYHLKLYGEPIASLDVKQMQPTILSKVLVDNIGSNPFSDAIFKGEDVYVLLQRHAELKTRDEAKVLLFRLIFGKPMDDIGKVFKGDTGWVEWINSYKSKEEPRNPHKEDKHTNLAWLLQYSEVQVMSCIWRRLWKKAIPFLTIHDDILVRKSDKDRVYKIMEEELSQHFKSFKIVVDH